MGQNLFGGMSIALSCLPYIYSILCPWEIPVASIYFSLPTYSFAAYNSPQSIPYPIIRREASRY